MATAELELVEDRLHGSDPLEVARQEEPAMGTSSENNKTKLSVLPLAMIVFYSVSGGPFGVEESIRSAGAFFAIVGFSVFPLVWSIPEALMTAELSSAFPEAAGGVAWVEEAFGEFPAWMAGFLGWISGTTDNAIYPVLFLEYFYQVTRAADQEEGNTNSVERFAFLSLVSLALGFINWLGLPVVGNLSVVLGIIAMSPFLILVVVGSFHLQPVRWMVWPSDSTAESTDDDTSGGFFPNAAGFGGVYWRPFLNNLFWNLNSFDSASSFAADVDDPGRVFPRGMALAVVFVVFGYLVPMVAALGATETRQSDWVDGYFATAASDIVGPWLGGWTVFAAGISNLGLFQAELSADSFQLMGMAERGYVPMFFSKRSRHGTPTYSIALGIAIIVLFGASDLSTLIEMLNFNYGISLLLEYFAFLKLRIYHPELGRPWKVPLGTAGCTVLFLPTIFFTVATMLLARFKTLGFSIGVNLFGYMLYKARSRGLWKKNPYSVVGNAEPAVV